MYKGIEWLKREIPNLRGYAVVIDEIDGGLNPVTTISLKDVYRLINQLDEPEVTHEQVVEWIENNEFYCHATAETVLENAVDKGELGYYGTKYSVVEKPVIPKFVAEFIEDRKHVFVNTLQWVFHRAMENRESDWFKEEYEWVKHNSETFARAWLDGYEVKEEPLYFALIKGHELVNDEGEWSTKYWNLWVSGGSVFPADRLAGYDDFLTTMSKEEWSEWGINDTNADFVRVEELEE